jgi:hypothetical protein
VGETALGLVCRRNSCGKKTTIDYSGSSFFRVFVTTFFETVQRELEVRFVTNSFTHAERRLIDLWERHIRLEFAVRDAAATVATMSSDNYVNHVPVMTGGRGQAEML